MHKLSCVLFKVYMVDPYLLFLALDLDLNCTCTDYRVIELRDLICLRQVGIEVVLTVKYRELVYRAAQSKACLDCVLNCCLVDNRERSGHTCTDRAASCVGCSAELSRAAAEYLSLGEELCVYLQTNDGPPFFHADLLLTSSAAQE